MRVRSMLLIQVAWILVVIAGLSGAVLPVAAQQTPRLEMPQTVASSNRQTSLSKVNDGDDAKLNELPDSPGAVLAKSAEPVEQQSSTPQSWAAPSSSPQSAQAQSSDSQTQSAPQKPVGTAAAEAPDTTGIAASQPAGVAIAPAKQRRVRTIVLRVGAIVGAAVAVGSVVALTEATSAKPPGAH
jgi:hypothetical protein